jgi:hypothetical protein
MADYRAAEGQRDNAERDREYSDIPDRGTEEIRDEERDEEDFDDTEDLDEEDEEDDTDLGKNVLDQERGAAPGRGLTAEIGSEGGSAGSIEVEREPDRRTHAGEATTTGGQPAEETRFDRRRGAR